MSSVFADKAGEWKLGGFEVLGPLQDDMFIAVRLLYEA
jgi:hypothetical protein